MSSKRIRLTFEGQSVGDPLIYRMGREFQVVTNIRMADVERDFGWVILEVEGDADEIERSLAWMQARGVRIDPVSGDVLEG